MIDISAKQLRSDYSRAERKSGSQHAALPVSNLPPMPECSDEEICFEPFEVQGLDTVEVLRPKRDVYRPTREDAPALVLVPGLGMDCRGYIRQFPLGKLADIHMIQAHNEATPGEEGLGHFARGVEEYILAKELHKRPGGFVLGGCSMGGAVSINVCARGKIQPRALLLIGSFANCKQLPYYQRLLAPLAWHLPFEFVKRAARRVLMPFKNGFIRDAHVLASASVRRTNGYYGRAIMALTRQNQLAEAAKLSLPTLVIHGTGDWVLRHAAGVEMAETIPGAKLVSIKGGGHGFFFTHAEQVNAHVAEFLEGLS